MSFWDGTSDESYVVDVSIDPCYLELAKDCLSTQNEWLVNEEQLAKYLRSLICFLLESQQVRQGAEVSISLATDEQIHQLNREYRGIDSTTDVLSFPCDYPDARETDEFSDEEMLLGDILISPNVAYRQSCEYGNTFVEELNLLTTHGLLHLLGYDHIQDDEAEIMEALERKLLSQWSQRS